ncbi:M56 family metallopeptidase [Pedobacter insulae]|uniref:BlaR1 peptidase M56 n=1 Tax=Pedobacter insulae TaxID=414048 RepID=A0A1I2USP8_9SPHI|nr:M56 family metallopeptidase [Pedobacter insulae]SFG78827.1 BlaR1 peptidase M56 [Pedobacter insulae]
MPELILVLFKINLVLLLFAAAYYLVLRRLTFYTVNRAFLVIGIIFSTVYPFIDLTNFLNRQEQIAMMPTIDVNQFVRDAGIVDYWQIVVVIFYVGVLFMAMRLIAQFFSLYRVHRRSKPGAVRNLNVRILEGQVSPFSFWQTVYINPNIHSANELDTILAHEQVHVKEWHTLDIILAEISVVFYWFNPGIWLMKKAIKENIEFITDARIVKKGVDKKAYQYSLLGVGSLQASVGLVNNFNLSDLKKRIKMMNTKRSSPKKLIIYAFVLPILLITTLAFTVNKRELKEHLNPLTKALVKVDLLKEEVSKIERKEPKAKIFPKELSVTPKDTVKIFHYVITTITLDNDSVKILQDLPEGIRLERSVPSSVALKGIVRGMRVNPDSVYANGTTKIENIKIALRKPGMPFPNTDDHNLNEVIVQGYATKGKSMKLADSANVGGGKSVIQFNGRQITEEELRKISPEDIKSVLIERAPSKTTKLILVGKKIKE